MGRDEHILMVPMMAHGHLIPFLALATQIQQRTGFTVTIANTPLNINYLKSTISTNSNKKLLLAELPYSSSDHGLPPNIESTENLPFDLIGTFFSSSKSLSTPVHRLLIDIKEKDGKPPLCLITDVFFGWAVDVARRAGTINVTFTTCGGYGTLAYLSLWLNLPHRKTDSEEFHIPGFPERCRLHTTQLHRFLRMADGSDEWSRFMQPQLSGSLGSHGMLCNTAEEIEPQAVEWLRNYTKLPVWTIGPLLPQPLLEKSSPSGSTVYKQHSGKTPGVSSERCVEWLDLQDPQSVLYISFGSQNTISPSQMMELAGGLEKSKIHFIWVIRPPTGFDLKGEFKAEWLPEGFEDRMTKTKHGLLVKDWAPQLEILSHKSTGAFLSHCGWNSVTESLSQGVPIIGWPIAAEQSFNSKMLVEEMGVSVELTRGSLSIEGKEVKKVIQLVFSKTGKGEEMRRNASKIKEQIRASVMEEGDEKGYSVKALDDFLSNILSRREVHSVG
ncbi:UDP-glycosyltransferase 92A1-like [Mangifera indica]|uniref:UDP-glycosyltransferase 92A1-like n=1 Tax=Mangifera indica TaxID=29780 RepID=UPI001CFAD1A5|nr:UDP-glycosyltransferase 92A1-like [Mangifera indica]